MASNPDAIRPGDAVRIRGERWRVTRRVAYDNAIRLDVTGLDRHNRGSDAAFLLPFDIVERFASIDTPRVVRPTAWRRIARATLADATPTPHALRTAARASIALVPFQLEPALAITSAHAVRMLIADEVGLGKTIQAGLIVAELMVRQSDARVLIVCPAGLREQWQAELANRFGLAAAIFDPAYAARVACERGIDANPWTAEAIVVTSIDYVKRAEVMRAFEPLLWDLVVFDEAHALASVSDRATAAALLGARARRVVMLTATPHSGDDGAFNRMCGVGALDGDAPLLVFRRSREDAGIVSRRHVTTMSVRPSIHEAAVHRLLLTYARRVWADSGRADAAGRLAVTVLMRRACSSPMSLGRSVERRLSLLAQQPGTTGAQLALPFLDTRANDDEPESVLAAPGLRDASEERLILERLLSCARAATAAESKIAALARLLRRIREPALVFTEYRDTLAHIAERLGSNEVLLHGGMTARQRGAAAYAFTHGTAPLMLATDAASEGLNLHARCRVVINLELPWTPTRVEQRIGRVDRIGQTRTVHAIHLVARGTGEELLLRRLADRAMCARRSLEQRVSTATGADLREQARIEAARLQHVRALAVEHVATSPRPALSVVRRRPDRRRERFWVWRLTLTDARGRLIWESLLPLRAEGIGSERGRSAARQLGTDAMRLAAAATSAAAAVLDETAATCRRTVDVLGGRERAMVQALENRHARLAAELLQPGLFDRRNDHAAAAQSALLANALAGAHARLNELDAAAHPRMDECRLVFAVALR
jgi:superfamily II DNA or RNA helicase